MASNKEAWGVEVGAQAIKVMKLARSANGVSLEDFDVMPFKNVLTTPDLNVEEAIRVNLEALAQKHEFHNSNVVVSVPGNMAFARFAKLPPVEAKNVRSIVAYEAQQQIPFPIEEVEWDYQVFAQEDAPDIEVGIFAITKERVANFLSNYRAVGMKVDTLTLSPVAVYNAFAFENEMEGGHGDNTVYLDIGSVSTDIIVVEAGGIWLRTLPLGGNHFTNALMKQFKISFAKAEKLKLEAGTSKYAKQIFQAMRGVFSDLVTEIQRSLGFYTSLNRDSELKQIVGVGSTWKLPGLQKYLKQNLQMKVIRPDGYARLEVEDRRAAEFSSVAVNMATVYGLALQGLGIAAVDANILPQSILRQRMMKAKQPWIGAAAACVVGAAAIAPISQFMDASSFKAEWEAPSAYPTMRATINQAEQHKGNYDTVQTSDPRPGIRNFRRSVDYANLYPMLLEDIAAAMSTVKPANAVGSINWDIPAEVERVGKISRNKRGQVWVKEIVTQYKPPVAAAIEESQDINNPGGQGNPNEYIEPAPTFTSTTRRVAEGGKERALILSDGSVSLIPIPYPGQPAAVASADAGASPNAPAPAPAPEAEVDQAKMLALAPRIVVTIRGETTMDDTTLADLLQKNLVTWMKENAKRSDRPYILITNLSIPSIKPRSDVAKTTTTGSDGQQDLRKTPTPKSPDSGTPVGPGGNDRFRPPGGPGGTGGPGAGGSSVQEGVKEVKTPEGWYATVGGADTGFSIGALIPKRPLSKEDDSNDSVFTLKFEIILLSPDEARKTILTPTEEKATPDETTAKGSGSTGSTTRETEDQS